ncbi:nickel pincer cofactor biosynthesis protein LarC [soil metagenome]
MGHEGHDHEHGDHDHDHDHAHPNHAHADHAHGDHAHADHAHAPVKRVMRPDLPFRAGEGKILFLDAPSGLAGDMIIASLIDLGVPPKAIAAVLEMLPLEGYHLHLAGKERSGIMATHFDVHVEGDQPERTHGSIRSMLEASKLPEGIKGRALAIFRKLAEAESKVHKMPVDEVHFHEVGAVDAIVDVVGASAALEYLGAEVWVSPLPMGRGFVKARHGILPLPAPATIECLRGFATYDAGIEAELVTPTGAAIVAAQAKGSIGWPSFAPEVIGWGSGTRDLADRPNLVRAILGVPQATAGTHVVLEANLDDATGELLGAAIEALFGAGALDAWATPITMKKGRPAVTLSAIADLAHVQAVEHAILLETTSIGVRKSTVSRVERPRRIVEIATKYGLIPVKVAEGPYGPPQIKPELDACALAAKSHGAPLRVVLAEVMSAAIVAFSSFRT